MKLELIKNMGIRWTLYRTQYEIKKKFGYLERTYKPIELTDVDIGQEISKLFIKDVLTKNLSMLSTSRSTSNEDLTSLTNRANEILNDRFQYFSDKTYDFKGWNYSVKTEKFAPLDKHWSKISDLNSDFGDIKWIWELNRFKFSYDLVRAYLYTNDSKYVEKFWELFDDFISKNPLEYGPNYRCSQEMSFRTNAWIFALYHFIDHDSSTEERVLNMVKSIEHYGQHIYKHLNFSVEAVKNNHSISESATLTVIGNTFNFLPDAEKLYQKGFKVLEKEINWQIKDDGSFIQHSHNYHRLVLQNLSWHFTSMKSVNKSISPLIRDKAKKSLEFLCDIVSDVGEVPNYGMNDGSYIMPLTEREYSDYRPVLQCISYQLDNQLKFDSDGVNEIVSLLNSDFNSDLAPVIEHQAQSAILNNFGGYHILTYGKFKVFVKSKSYKERPVQADMNHVDIWYDGKCIFGDAGSYSYNDATFVLNYYNGTASHNTVLINDDNQMIKGSRFIWFNWSKSKKPIIQKLENSVKITIELINYNEYRHIREINVFRDKVMVEDTIINSKKLDTNIKLQWLSPLKVYNSRNNSAVIVDDDWKVKVESNLELTAKVHNGEKNDEYRGWISSTYGEQHPAYQIVYETQSSEESIVIKTSLLRNIEG